MYTTATALHFAFITKFYYSSCVCYRLARIVSVSTPLSHFLSLTLPVCCFIHIRSFLNIHLFRSGETAGRNTNFILLFSFGLILLIVRMYYICLHFHSRWLVEAFEVRCFRIMPVRRTIAYMRAYVICFNHRHRHRHRHRHHHHHHIAIEIVRLAKRSIAYSIGHFFGLLRHNRTRVDTCRSYRLQIHAHAHIHTHTRL